MRRPSRRVIVAPLLAAWTAFGSSDRQAIGNDKAESNAETAKSLAGRLLNEGNQFFAAGKHEEALARYEAAYAAYPSAKIFFNFGEAHRALGRPIRAAEFYDRLLKEGNLSIDSKLYKTTAKKLREVEAALGRLEIHTEPEGAEVAIDGAPVEALALAPIRVEAGRHEVRASRSGFHPGLEWVEVRPGQTASVRIVLSEIGPAAAAPPPPLPLLPAVTPRVDVIAPGEGEGTLLDEWWFWTAVGTVVAVSLGVAVIASSGREGFVPRGELGETSLDDGWSRL